MSSEAPLEGRVALVTGASNSNGIGWAVANRLHELGASVVASGWPVDDETSQNSVDPSSVEFAVERRNLSDESAPTNIIDDVVQRHGKIDLVVAAHARSSSHGLGEVTAGELDACWAVNVRSVVLMAQRFAQAQKRTGDGSPAGRMIWFTSGQHLGPMVDEIAYVASKGALHQLTRTLSRELEQAGIVANCINPGPVDTGWADQQVHSAICERFPDRHWTTPTQTADLVAFLVSDAGAVIRGQVIDAESGFNRFGV